MKTLTIAELEYVNGADGNEITTSGLKVDLTACSKKGQFLGASIGSTVDAMTNIFGFNTNFTVAFGKIGAAVGFLAEFNILKGLNYLFTGIVGISSAIGKETSSTLLPDYPLDEA